MTRTLSAIFAFLLTGLVWGCSAGINGASESPIAPPADPASGTFSFRSVNEIRGGNISGGAFLLNSSAEAADLAALKSLDASSILTVVVTEAPAGMRRGDLYAAQITGPTYSDALFDNILTDIAGIPTPNTAGENSPYIAVGTDGKCAVMVSWENKLPAFYVSSDYCITWAGPYMPRDPNQASPQGTGTTVSALEFDSSNNIIVAWSDAKTYSRTSNMYVCRDRCTAQADGTYTCGTDACGEASKLAPYISIAVSGDREVYAWTDGYVPEGEETRRIYAEFVTDGGASGSYTANQEIPIPEGVTFPSQPKVEMDSEGRAFLVFKGIGGTIYLSKTTADGTDFSAPTAIVSAIAATSATIVANGENLFIIAGEDATPAEGEYLGYFKSTDHGETWDAFVRFEGDPIILNDSSPVISAAANGSNMFAMYRGSDNNIWVYTSANAGTTWSDAHVQVNSVEVDTSNSNLSGSDIVPTQDGKAVLVWTDDRNGEEYHGDIYSSIISVNGSFTDNALVSAINYGTPSLVSLSSGTGMVVSDGRNGTNFELYFMSGFADPIGTKITSSTTKNQLLPNAKIDASGKINVVYFESDGPTGSSDGDIYITSSADNGASWSTPAQVSTNSNFKVDLSDMFPPPALLASESTDPSERLIVAWGEGEVGADQIPNWDVYLRERVNGTWQAVESLTPATPTRLNMLPTTTIVPSSATLADAGTLYVAAANIEFAGTSLLSAGFDLISKPLNGSFGEWKQIKSVSIANYSNENACIPWDPWLVSDRDGRLIFVWANAVNVNDPSSSCVDGGIYWTQSTDGGTTWSTERKILDADGANIAGRILDVKVEASGDVNVLFSQADSATSASLNTPAYLATGYVE